MTAATSNKKSSFFGTRYRNDISQNKKTLIVHIVLELLGLPVLAVIALIMMYLSNEGDNIPRETQYAIESGCSAFAVISVITIFASLFLGINIALTHFNYLYKKSIADMNYALPLSSTQRFFADYLSGFTMYMAPAVGAVLLSIAIFGIGTPFIEGVNEFWEIFPEKAVFIVLIAMMLFYTLCVLAITFCGNTFEAVFSIIAFNALIPAAVACIWSALCESSSYGIDTSAILMNNIFTSTSPVGAVFFFFVYETEAYQYTSHRFETSSFASALMIKWIIITLIVIAIYLIAAYLLYRHRKAEDVSKPYVYKTAFYAMMTMSVFCILSLFISFGGFLAAGIVLCAIGWFIMEVITRRGFKKFWQAGLGFAAAVVSVIVVCKIFDATNGLGMAKKVPSAMSVESIAVSNEILPSYTMVFKDKKVIEESVKLHKELVDRHFNPDDYDYEPINDKADYIYTDIMISLNYSTFTGSSVMRQYELPSGMMGELTKAMILSDDYAEQIYDVMSTAFDLTYYNDNPDRVTIEYKNKSGEYDSKVVSQQFIKNISKAYYDDLMNMTEDDLLNAKFCGYIFYEYFVLDTFENTIAVLESENIYLDDITKSDIAGEISFEKYPMFFSDAQRIFEEDDDNETNGLFYYDYEDDSSYKRVVVDSITSTFNYSYFNFSYETNPTDEAIELVNRSTPIVLGEKPIAVFDVNGTTLYLLDRNDNEELLAELGAKDTISFFVGSDENGWDYYD